MGEKYSAVEDWIDEELLRTMRSTSNLKQKVAEFFELLRDPVYRYLYRVLGDPEEAKDLTQEAFLRLHACLSRGQTVGNIRAWIFRVAHNLAINQQKKNSYRQSFHVESFDITARRENQDSAPDAEQRLLKKEEHERFQVALAKLTSQERQCLDLRAEGLSYREIAEVLEMRLPTLVKFFDRVIIKLMRETYD